jgi:hypothetical protein
MFFGKEIITESKEILIDGAGSKFSSQGNLEENVAIAQNGENLHNDGKKIDVEVK